MQTTRTGEQLAAKPLQVCLVTLWFSVVGQKKLEYVSTKPGFNWKADKIILGGIYFKQNILDGFQLIWAPCFKKRFLVYAGKQEDSHF